MPVTEFGWPLPKRQAYLQDLAKDPTSKVYESAIDFMGQQRVLPVWRVPLDMPRYRLLNGRTSSLQQEWLAANPGKPSDFFSRDPESDEAQKVQHQLLKELIGEKDLFGYFARTENRQKDFLILDHLAFVINGNRRLCAWRELRSKDSQTYGYFAHIDVIVLPKADDEAVDRLEAELQLEPDILADYQWHAFANMLRDRMRLHKLDVKRLARLYKRRESEIEEYLDMRDYAAEYLKARGKDGRWSEVGETEFAFRAMVKARKQISEPGDKRLFETGSFALLDDPEGGRLYEYIPDLLKYRKQVREKLLQHFKIEAEGPAPADLLGADPQEVISQRLAETIDDQANRPAATDIIKEVIEAEDALAREKNSAGFVLKQLQKANAAVQSALMGIHRPDVARVGASETLEQIESGVAKLRAWLKSNV